MCSSDLTVFKRVMVTPSSVRTVAANTKRPLALLFRWAAGSAEKSGVADCLDAMIDAMASDTDFDELQLRRLKKRRLQIRDTISLLQMQLVPDVPA